MVGCGKKIEVAVTTKYSAKMITVKCGSTSPYGSPWLCDECEKVQGNTDWRYEAEMAGEQWDSDY